LRTGNFIFILLLPLFLFSQQEPFLTSFRYQMSLINPAYAGAEAKNIFAITSRNQWATLENSPKAQVMTFSSQRKNNVGLGVSISSNKYFVEKNTTTYIDFSYRLTFNQSTNLFLGLKGGAAFYKANLLGLSNNSGSTIDPAQGLFSRVNPNLGIGILLQSESFWASFSVPRLFKTTNSIDFSETATDFVHTYFAGGGIFKINENFSLKPSFLLRKVDDQPLTSEFLGMVSFGNFFEIGASYRTTNSMGLISFVKIKNYIDIGYAYESPVQSALTNLSIKTHEIILRFKLDGNASEDSKEVPTEE
jgi:type IX secretion system PorP/SprF family membrane protein